MLQAVVVILSLGSANLIERLLPGAEVQLNKAVSDIVGRYWSVLSSPNALWFRPWYPASVFTRF